MIRVCIDTNVWLSGLAFKGPPAKVVRLAEQRKIQVVLSPFILDEVKRNLVHKFAVKVKAARRLRYGIVVIDVNAAASDIGSFLQRQQK